MSLQFPYLPVPIKGPPGAVAVHPTGTAKLWRPFVDIRLVGPASSKPFMQALVDTGAQDTIFPWGAHTTLGIALRPDAGHVLRWRGTAYPLRYADVELELSAGGSGWQWSSLVGFCRAPLPYVLLGYYGFLQYMDATFRGDQMALELETNSSFPGTTT